LPYTRPRSPLRRLAPAAWPARGVRSRIATVLIASAVAVSVGAQSASQSPAPADAAKQAQALSKRAADRMKALEREADDLARREQTVLTELRKLEVDEQIKTGQLKSVQAQRATVQQQLAAAAVRARDLQAEAERQQPDVDARLVQLYKIGRAGYWRLLLDVDDLRQLGRAYRTAAALDRIDRDRVEEHRRTLASLAAERASLQARASDLQKLEIKGRTARAAADAAVAARTALVTSIDARRDLNAQLAGELQEAARRLSESIAAIAQGRAAPAPSLPMRPFHGALAWPADGVLTARFGRQTDRLDGARTGIELSLPEGAPVHAVYDGVVAYAEPFTGYGNLVIVDHGDRSYSLYGFLDSVSVHKGDRVEPSTTVGVAGRNLAGNPSLYFELRIDGKAVDPLQWLKRQ
ncbi:MAG: murein hydrolase activator EnvC family protein, partial [Vicinamibacterales bacterium]